MLLAVSSFLSLVELPKPKMFPPHELPQYGQVPQVRTRSYNRKTDAGTDENGTSRAG